MIDIRGLSPAEQVRAALKELTPHHGSASLNGVIAYLTAQEKCLVESMIAATGHDDTNIVRGRIREVQTLKATLMGLGNRFDMEEDSSVSLDTDY